MGAPRASARTSFLARNCLPSLGLCLSLLCGGCSSQPLASGATSGGSSGALGSGGGASPHMGGNGGAGGNEGQPELTTLFERIRISSDASAEYHQRAHTEVEFPSESVARATLQVELESPCFPFEAWTAESIPEGHNWPLLCDAFDRLITVTLDDPADPEGEEPPGLELVRAVTPFGGPLRYSADVTDVVNGLPGRHQLRVELGTFGDPEGKVSGAKGEWIVTVRLELTPGEPERRVLRVLPLLARWETNAEPPAVTFEAPDGASTGRIEYRATGHGSARGFGCISVAEEFCPRTHSLWVDGALADEFVAWRDDCDTLCTLAHAGPASGGFDYCMENPCGAIESVRAPRANWCPGSVTPPRAFENSELAKAGPHEFGLSLNRLDEGGLWMVSATYFAYE